MWLVLTEVTNNRERPLLVNSDNLESINPTGGDGSSCMLQYKSGRFVTVRESSRFFNVAKLNQSQPTIVTDSTPEVAGLSADEVKEISENVLKNHLRVPNSQLINRIKQIVAETVSSGSSDTKAVKRPAMTTESLG